MTQMTIAAPTLNMSVQNATIIIKLRMENMHPLLSEPLDCVSLVLLVVLLVPVVHVVRGVFFGIVCTGLDVGAGRAIPNRVIRSSNSILFFE